MLFAFARLGASLRLFSAKGPQLPLPRAHLPRTRLSTLPRRPQQTASTPRHYHGYLAVRSHTTMNMFKKAVHDHNVVAATTIPAASNTAASNPAYKQPSLVNTLSRTVSTQRPGTRPVTFGADNVARKNAASAQRPSSQVSHGTKRTSSGMAKSWSSHEDAFEYPTLNISELEKENDFPAYRTPSRSNTGGLATALFDEDDFDSDIDLDIEDPATKGTVTYPKLPPASPTATKDSGYSSRPQSVQPKIELNSSQPIPWSSSPAEHFKTPPKPQPPKSKRRALPWSQQQTQPKQQLTPEPEEDMANQKRKSAAVTSSSTFTPLPKDSSKSQYPWNTTASAIKLQQKTLREQHKAKIAESIDDTENVKRKKKNVIAKMFLSDEQKNVLDLVIQHKKSVFFTGSAGTGKSVLLREIISGLRKKFIREPDRVAVTASTGLAACNIGGVTIHSFAGIGLGKEPAEDLVKKIRRNAKAKQRWMRTKVLIMDEVSMVDGDLFDKLEQIARTIRNNGRPFGGIQLVITGDFFQLPPVPEFGKPSKFAFDAGTWNTSIEHTIGLHHVFRQKDPVFAGMLNEMREGRMSNESIANFRKLDRPLPASEGNIEATELFPTRMEVDRANNLRMQQLHGDTFSFEARDGGTITNKEQRDRLLQNCMVPEVVHLKKGAQVMLVKNMDDTLVNGSLGKVIGFMTEQQFTFWKENEEDMLEGNISEAQMKTEMAKTVLGLNTAQVFPLIRFAIADGTTRDLLCKREDWKVELPNGEVQASRSQIPLILAWALSIHKAQGQTLERVRVDLGRVFEKGQAYVALSRATSMAGLQILRFDPRKIMAHEKVRSFYSSLSRAEQVEAKAKSATVLGKMQAANEKQRQKRDADDED